MNPGGGRLTRDALSAQVADAIKRYIMERGLKAGDRLPTIDAFCQQFGASRTVVREAIKALEMLGMVQVRHGDGCYVHGFDPRPFASQVVFTLYETPDAERLRLLMEARIAFESSAIRLGLWRAGPADLERLGRWVEAMEEAAAYGRTDFDIDLQFHSGIVGLAHNPILDRFIDVLHEVFLLLRKYPEAGTLEASQRIARRHRELYETLLSRNVQLAEATLVVHIQDSLRARLSQLAAAPATVEILSS